MPIQLVMMERRIIILFLGLFVTRITVLAFVLRHNSGRLARPTKFVTIIAATAAAPTDDPLGGGELTSTLMKLEGQWALQQRSSKNTRGKPQWSKLLVPNDTTDNDKDDKDDDDDDDVFEASTTVTSNKDLNVMNRNPNVVESDTAGTTAAPPAREEEYVWMLEPPNQSIPSCVIVLLGGAGLGQYPQVVYNALLSHLAVHLNAVCLTVPYEVGLDHFTLSKRTGELIRRALLLLNPEDAEDDDEEHTGPTRKKPVFLLAHSLGCKLQTIYMAATGMGDTMFEQIGFLAYNNFSFGQTIQMARTFADELKQATTTSGASSRSRSSSSEDRTTTTNTNTNNSMFNSLFDLAEKAIEGFGVDFSPTAAETERLVSLRYNQELQAKTRLFVFDEDTLDSSVEFQAACAATTTPTIAAAATSASATAEEESRATSPISSSSSSPPRMTVSKLPGGHLSPVYLQWNATELVEEAMGGPSTNTKTNAVNNFVTPEMAKEALNGFQGAAFGDEQAFNILVKEITDWILGN